MAVGESATARSVRTFGSFTEDLEAMAAVVRRGQIERSEGPDRRLGRDDRGPGRRVASIASAPGNAPRSLDCAGCLHLSCIADAAISIVRLRGQFDYPPQAHRHYAARQQDAIREVTRADF